jgi:hypothetical protein
MVSRRGLERAWNLNYSRRRKVIKIKISAAQDVLTAIPKYEKDGVGVGEEGCEK